MKFLVVLAALAVIFVAVHAAKQRISNGSEAVPHSAPYIVSLRETNTSGHHCGGTIVNKEWIVTAAHCVMKATGMVVVAGLHVRQELDEKTQQRVVDFSKLHELYSGAMGPYNIAVLHVSEPFVFNEFVKAATLPAREEVPFGKAHLYGWGQTEIFGAFAEVLQTAEIEVIDWQTCGELIRDSRHHETTICSSSFYVGTAACSADSGGPLVKEIENAPSELIGIVSWVSFLCGWLNIPSVYTRVSAHIDWIAKVMNAYYALY